MHAPVAAAVLASLLAAGPGDPAAKAPRESPPPPGPAPTFRLPEIRRFALENGLAVTLVQVGRMPKVSVQLALRSGTGNEGPAETGLASLVATMLLEGTTTRSATEIAALAARWGGSVEAAVTPDETVVGGEVLSEFAPDRSPAVGRWTRWLWVTAPWRTRIFAHWSTWTNFTISVFWSARTNGADFGSAIRSLSGEVSSGEDRIEDDRGDRIQHGVRFLTARTARPVRTARPPRSGPACRAPSARPLPLDHLSGRGRAAVTLRERERRAGRGSESR